MAEIAGTIGAGASVLVLVLSWHPFLLLALGVVGIPLFNFGRALGLPLLFWHEDGRAQAMAGVATTLLVGSVAFVAFLLGGGRPPAGDDAGPVLLGAVFLWGAIVAGAVGIRWARFAAPEPTDGVGLAPAIREVAAGRPGRLRAVQVRPWPFALGVLGGAVAVLGALLVSRWLHAHVPLDTAPPWISRVLGLPEGTGDPWPHALAFLFVAASLLAWRAVAPAASPATALCLLVGLACAVYGFMAFRGWNPTLVGLVVVALLGVAGSRRARLRLGFLAAYYPTPVAYPPGPDARRAARAAGDLLDFLGGEGAAVAGTLAAGTGATIASRAPAGGRAPAGDGPRPLIVLCASGGGIRAATWAAGILGRLDESDGFRPAARLLTGASGGMVGATCWVGSLHAARRRESAAGADPAAAVPGAGWRALVDAVAQDSLTAVTRRLVLRDLPFAFLPWTNARDRGQALEDAWRANAGSWLDVRFGDLREGEAQGLWPSLVFSPMLVEDGRRLVLSNLDLRAVTANEVYWVGAGGRSLASDSAYHLERLFPGTLAALPLRTAARLSAAFPWVSPAVVLPTAPRRRVVDAGYFDTYGLHLACAWLREYLHAARERLARQVSRILVIQIRDNVSELSLAPGDDGTAAARGADEGGGAREPAAAGRRVAAALARGFEWFSSPVEGVASARSSAMVFRNDAELETVMQLFDEAMGRGFCRTTIFELKGEVSLSWYLTRAEVAVIAGQLESAGIEGKLRDVRGWLAGR